MNEFILSGFADEASSTLSGQIEILKKLNMSFMEMRLVDGKNIMMRFCQLKINLTAITLGLVQLAHILVK